jgi:hypothetical protein
MPSLAAIVCWATIGDFRHDQISALPGRTSAIAQLVSSGELLAKANVNFASSVLVRIGTAGTAIGGSAFSSSCSTVSSDLPSSVPGPQVTSRARTASMHCPNVAPRTATPVDTIATSVMPGMASTADRLLTDRTVPLMVGGRHVIVGIAPGTSRSIANFLRPVTAASASMRLCGVPTTVKSGASVNCTEASVV